MKQHVLVALANDEYFDQARQLFTGVILRGAWDGDLLILTRNMRPSNERWFRSRGILVRRCSRINAPASSNYPSIWLSKLDIYHEYFCQWKTVVYLDTDIIVRHSLKDLQNLHGFFAAAEVNNKTIKEQFSSLNKKDIALMAKFGVRPSDPAFNAGVMVFTTNLLKKNTHEELISLAKHFSGKVKFGDQGVQNIYFGSVYKQLPRLYNTYPEHLYYQYFIPPTIMNAAIFHFVGNMQYTPPWHQENYFYREWKRNLEKADAMKVFRKDKIQREGVWTRICLRIITYFYSDHILHLARPLWRIIGQIFPRLYEKV